MTLVVVASLAPRAHADGGDDMPLDFQFESPAELAGDLSLPDAAVDPGGGDHADGGGDATAGVVPTQDQGGGVWGTLDWGGGGDEPQRADAPVVAQADEERSVGTSPKGLAAEQEAESDVGRHGVVVGLDPKLTPEENMRDAIDGIYEAEARIEAAVFDAQAFASYAREVARMGGDYATIRNAAKQADVAATVADEQVAVAAIIADNIAFQAGRFEEAGDYPGAAEARGNAEVAKAHVKDLAARAASARRAAYDANTADVDTGRD